jgi:hypothetical protein
MRYQENSQGVVMSEEVKNEFEIITGTNNVILVAPHGYIKKPRDDENTAQLTRLLAKKLNCYAVINEIYKRTKYDPKNKEWPNGREPIDPTIPKVDLNFIPQIKEASLEEKWLGTIKGLKQDILKKHAHCFVFLIHGAGDKNVKEVDEKADVLLGVGRVKADSGKKDRPTATNETIKQLIRLLKDEGSNITAVVAKAAKTDSDDIGNRYAGHSNYNLNQYFVTRVDGILNKTAQAIQLEFKKTGFRDTIANVEATVDKLAQAMGEMPGIVVQIPEEKKKQDEPQHLIPSGELQPDTALVEAAYAKLKKIFVTHYEAARNNAMLEAGQYIVKTFYDNDYQLAKDKTKAIKKKSLHQLIKKLQGETGNAPSKTWIYDAVGLTVDEQELHSFRTYGKISVSHKLRLLPVKNIERKKQLVVEIDKEKLSVRELSRRVRELTYIKPELSDLITHPDKLFTKEYASYRSKKSLTAMDLKQRERITKRVEKYASKIEEEIKRQQNFLQKYKKLLETMKGMKK